MSALYPRLKKQKVFKIVKGAFGFCENPVRCKISKNVEGEPFRDIDKFSIKKRKVRILKQSHSAEELEKGDPLGFLKLQFAAKYLKNFEEDPLETKKFRKKVAQCRKNFKGGPFALSQMRFRLPVQ